MQRAGDFLACRWWLAELLVVGLMLGVTPCIKSEVDAVMGCGQLSLIGRHGWQVLRMVVVAALFGGMQLVFSDVVLAIGDVSHRTAVFTAMLEKKNAAGFFSALSTHDDPTTIIEAMPRDLINTNHYKYTIPGYEEGAFPLLSFLVLQTQEQGRDYELLVEAMLAASNVDKEGRDSSSATSLAKAAGFLGRGCTLAAFTTLVDAGADVNASNIRNYSIVGYANWNDHQEGRLSALEVLASRPELKTEELAKAVKCEATVAIFQKHAVAKGVSTAKLFATYLLPNKDLPAKALKKAMAILEEEYKAGLVGEETLEDIDKLSATRQAIDDWMTNKRHHKNIAKNRAKFIRRLQTFIHQKKAAATNSNQGSGQECTVCYAASGKALAGHPDEAICRGCLRKWYIAGGKLSGLGVQLTDEEKNERAEVVTVDDLRELGFDDNVIAEAESERIRAELSGVPGWRFCSTPGCFNGKDVGEKDSLYFECGLCERKSCLGCGDDHDGSCDKDERTKAEVRRLAELGRKAPKPGEVAPEDGKFRPCYYCGILTERVDGCSTMACAGCKKSWDWNYGDPAAHPEYRGSQVHDFKAIEQHYEPLVPPHF